MLETEHCPMNSGETKNKFKKLTEIYFIIIWTLLSTMEFSCKQAHEFKTVVKVVSYRISPDRHPNGQPGSCSSGVTRSGKCSKMTDLKK